MFIIVGYSIKIDIFKNIKKKLIPKLLNCNKDSD